MDPGSITFTADGRVIVQPLIGPTREATEDDRSQIPEVVWPFWFHIRMPARGDSADG